MTEKALFNDGETYFAKKNYAAASRYFEKYLTYQHRDNEESVRQAEYYIAKSAFELRKKMPNSNWKNTKKYAYATNIELIDLYIGILEYESGKYKQTIKRFEKMDTDKLNRNGNGSTLFLQRVCLSRTRRLRKNPVTNFNKYYAVQTLLILSQRIIMLMQNIA